MRTWVIAGIFVVAATGAATAQDAAAGEQSFNQCRPCHDVGDDAKIKLGPPLNGLDGRTAGTFPGFNYSDANKSSGITWNQAAFKEYIANPQAKIPGTRMAFGGIKDEQVIGNLWAYINQFGPDGKKK
jgi:cytochrome c